MRTFDVALSFAGEDRKLAQTLAHLLKKKGLLVFYDDDEQAQLLGETLTEYLSDLYKNEASYCVVLVSKSYIRKRWTRLEWRAAQARAFEEFDVSYILPIRVDDSDLPGLLSTIGYLSLGKQTVKEIGNVIARKVKGVARINAVVRTADHEFRGGNFKKVITLLSDNRIYPKLLGNLTSLRLLADAFMHTGNNKDGARVLKDVTKRFTQDAESLFLLGVCQNRLFEFAGAIASLEGAVALAPHHTTALAELKYARRRMRTKRAGKA